MFTPRELEPPKENMQKNRKWRIKPVRLMSSVKLFIDNNYTLGALPMKERITKKSFSVSEKIEISEKNHAF